MITNTWLSIIPNIHGASVDRDATHKFIWDAFPGRQKGETIPYLFRVDEDTDSILVRSVDKPTWSSKAVKTHAEISDWSLGDFVQIDIHLTPRKRNSEGKEVPIDQDEVVEYVRQHLLYAGLRAAVVENDEGEEVYLQPTIDHLYVDYSANTRLPLTPIRVQGLFEVVDEVKLHEALCEGVGCKKFVGFGMLLLFPADAIR